MKKMSPKTFTLHSGKVITVRQPSLKQDLDRIVQFLSSLSARERNFLRYNVHERDTCAARLGEVDGKNHFRLIAELDGEIVGDATLDREPFAWSRHVAKLRGVIAPRHQKKGIGSILFRELASLAEEAGVEHLVAEVMPEQKAMIALLKNSGFIHEATLKGFLRDQHGKKHDLLIMTNDLIAVWEHLADDLVAMDIRMPHG